MSVTVFPDSVTLLPGESTPVTVSVDAETPAGTSQACVTVTVEEPEMILTGDIDAVVPAGTVARLVAPARFLNDLHVRGLLLNDPHGVIDCNGFDIHTHGGVLNLQGVEKTAWLRGWDLELPVGWQLGDRLAVAPTAPGVFLPSETTWMGSWQSTTRPANSPDVMLPDGQIVGPEVTNLSQTFVLKNASRIMMHEANDVPNVHSLKWLKVLDSGRTGELGFYPIHFHLLGDSSRGSLVEGVVVEGGKNHALVPHGSNGITIRDFVAYNTTNDAFWWDFPLDKKHTTNNSNDVMVDHMLVMLVLGTALKRTGFVLGAGFGNTVKNSVATCVQGGKESSGFHWLEPANQNIDGIVWNFHHDIAHNNKSDGINVWQNDSSPHLVEDFIGYHNGLSQIDHGAYGNRYVYRRCVLMGGTDAFRIHAVGPILLEDIVADGPLVLPRHQSGASDFVTIRGCQFTEVIYNETGNGGTERSLTRYEDSTLDDPSAFNFGVHNIGIVPTSEIEILKDGVITHRWAGGWT